MINRQRLFQKVAPTKEAKVYYIFCEGRCREVEYFNFFVALDSRIRIEIIPPDEDGNNSPAGLYEKACELLCKTEDNPYPKYDFAEVDELWFVIDTDAWAGKIDSLRTSAQQHQRWFVVQSNPCFEVWLYYHVYNKKPDFEGMEKSVNWKTYVDRAISGGFNPKEHPVYIEEAINNAKKNHCETDGKINLASTEVYKLAENIFRFIEKAIRRVANK